MFSKPLFEISLRHAAQWSQRLFPALTHDPDGLPLPVDVFRSDTGQLTETQPAFSKQSDDGLVTDVINPVEEVSHLLTVQAGQDKLTKPRRFDFPYRVGQVEGLLTPVVECPDNPVIGVPVAGVLKLEQKRLNILSLSFIGIYLG